MTMEEKRLLKIVEAGAICGCNRSTAYKLAATEWPIVKISERAYRVPLDGLLEWIECKKVEAAEERRNSGNELVQS